MQRACKVLAIAGLMLCVAAPVWAVLPGVTVTLTQTDTGFTRTVVSSDTGAYVLPNLRLGPYRLEVSLQGFRTYVQTGIVLQVNRNPEQELGTRNRERRTVVT